MSGEYDEDAALEEALRISAQEEHDEQLAHQAQKAEQAQKVQQVKLFATWASQEETLNKKFAIEKKRNQKNLVTIKKDGRHSPQGFATIVAEQTKSFEEEYQSSMDKLRTQQRLRQKCSDAALKRQSLTNKSA